MSHDTAVPPCRGALCSPGRRARSSAPRIGRAQAGTIRIGMQSIFSGARKAGAADGKKIAEVRPGLTIDSIFGVNGKITMRDDHTIVGYAIGWGKNTDKKPYIVDIEPGDWGRITELETEWKKQNHYI